MLKTRRMKREKWMLNWMLDGGELNLLAMFTNAELQIASDSEGEEG
jgi:hypothetical protein